MAQRVALSSTMRVFTPVPPPADTHDGYQGKNCTYEVRLTLY